MYELPTPQFTNGVSISAIKSLFNITYNNYYNICVNTPDVNLNPYGFSIGLADFRAAPYKASELKFYDHYFPMYTYVSTISGQWATYQNGQCQFDFTKLRSWMRSPTFTVSLYLFTSSIGNYFSNAIATVQSIVVTGGYLTVTLNPSVTLNAVSVFGGSTANQMVNIPAVLNQNQTYYLHLVIEDGIQYLLTPPPIDAYGNYKILINCPIGQNVVNLPLRDFYVAGTFTQSAVFAALTVQPKLTSNNASVLNLMRYDWYVVSQDVNDPVYSSQVTFDINTAYSFTNSTSGINTMSKIAGSGVVRCVATLQDTGYKYESHSFDWNISAGYVI